MKVGAHLLNKVENFNWSDWFGFDVAEIWWGTVVIGVPKSWDYYFLQHFILCNVLFFCDLDFLFPFFFFYCEALCALKVL